MATHDLVLLLDADEALDDSLKNAIQACTQNWLADGYTMNRLTNYCGQWIHYSGWYPDKKTRLFPKNEAHWAGEVHEKLHTNLSTTLLNGDLLHYTYHSRRQFVEKTEKYTTLAANEMYAKGKKVYLFSFVFSPLFRFLKMYFFQSGFLDGKEGFFIARITAFGVYEKYRKLKSLIQKFSD